MIRQIIAYIQSTILPNTCPQKLNEVLENIFKNNFGYSALYSFELVEKFAPRVKTALIRLRDEDISANIDPWFDWNSLNGDYIQGSCYIEPSDSPATKEAKINRLSLQPMKDCLESLNFDEFEFVCAAILRLIGARSCYRTKHSRDQGIDFFGQIYLGDLQEREFPFVKFQDNLSLWLIGQAKHYVSGKVSTIEIRNLIGSINIAKFKEYTQTTEPLSELTIRSCDPILVLFLTTGSFSRDAKKLAKNSGIILKDIIDLAKFLADKRIGIDGGTIPTRHSVTKWARDSIL